MNDAPLVRRLQRLDDLLPDQQCFVKSDRPTRGPLGQILALTSSMTNALMPLPSSSP